MSSTVTFLPDGAYARSDSNTRRDAAVLGTSIYDGPTSSKKGSYSGTGLYDVLDIQRIRSCDKKHLAKCYIEDLTQVI